MKWIAVVVVVVAFCPKTFVAANPRPKPHIETTEHETLWTGRFAHCDYGFYALLPVGMVAHSGVPPNPLHGFLVALPEVGTREEVTTDSRRYIWMNAEYDASDQSSTAKALAFYVQQVGAGEQKRRTRKREARLGTLPATLVHAEYDRPEGRIVEEVVIAFRGSIVYQIGLRTTASNYEGDKRQFQGVVAGFHVWRVHNC